MRGAVKRTFFVSASASILAAGGWTSGVLAATSGMDAVSITNALAAKDYASCADIPANGASGHVHYIYRTLENNLPMNRKAPYRMDRPFILTLDSIGPGDVRPASGDNRSFEGIYIGNRPYAMSSRAKEAAQTYSGSENKGQLLGARRVLSKSDRLRLNIMLDARKYLGTPYLFGAKYGQTETFDCSSFVKTVFAQNGLDLPRVSRDQALKGVPVKRSELEAGDLVFFNIKNSDGKRVGHVGIYAGDGMMIHTYGEGGVKYSSIDKGWWKTHYITARRLIRDGDG